MAGIIQHDFKIDMNKRVFPFSYLMNLNNIQSSWRNLPKSFGLIIFYFCRENWRIVSIFFHCNEPIRYQPSFRRKNKEISFEDTTCWIFMIQWARGPIFCNKKNSREEPISEFALVLLVQLRSVFICFQES